VNDYRPRLSERELRLIRECLLLKIGDLWNIDRPDFKEINPYRSLYFRLERLSKGRPPAMLRVK